MIFLLSEPSLGADSEGCVAGPGRLSATLEGRVAVGEDSALPFGPGFVLALEPINHGWEIAVTHAAYAGNLARLTPPFHFVPNPRFIEGWHFRDASNLGPNDGSVNAPQSIRDFIFSPEVDGMIAGGRQPTASDIEQVRQFGRGRLEILDFELTRPTSGIRASMVQMQYRVCLSWPGEFDAGGAS